MFEVSLYVLIKALVEPYGCLITEEQFRDLSESAPYDLLAWS